MESVPPVVQLAPAVAIDCVNVFDTASVMVCTLDRQLAASRTTTEYVPPANPVKALDDCQVVPPLILY